MLAPRPHGDGRAARVLVAVALVSVVAIDALYLAIVRSQGGPPPDSRLVAPFIAGYLALLGVLLAISLFTGDAVTGGLRGAASGGLLVLAVLSAFSIGAAVMIAALLSIAATVVTLARRPGTRPVVAAVAGAVVSIALLAAGLQLAWQQITCPATGDSGGTVPSFIGAGPAYACHDGHLTYTPG